jgi:hypothetical protein
MTGGTSVELLQHLLGMRCVVAFLTGGDTAVFVSVTECAVEHGVGQMPLTQGFSLAGVTVTAPFICDMSTIVQPAYIVHRVASSTGAIVFKRVVGLGMTFSTLRHVTMFCIMTP